MNIEEFIFTVQNELRMVPDTKAQIGSRAYRYLNMSGTVELLQPYFKKYRFYYNWEQRATNNGDIVLRCTVGSVDDPKNAKGAERIVSRGEYTGDFRAEGAEVGYWKRKLLMEVLGLTERDDDEAEEYVPTKTTFKKLAR